MLRHLTPLLALAAVALPLPAAAQSPDAGDRLRLGTWNLEHFGRRTRPGPRTAAQLEAIATFVRDRLQVDVLAVQEVDGAGPLRRLTAALGTSWQFVVGTTGGLFDDPGRIAVGFVWNADRVELLHAEEPLQLPRETADGLPIFHRVPVSAVFRSRAGGLDFRAITVHLKAGRGAENEAKRSAEVTAIAHWVSELTARAGEDRDIVLLGDFNHSYDAPAHDALTASGDFRYLRPERLRPTIIHFPDPIDHVVLGTHDGGLAEELRAGSHRSHDDDIADSPDSTAAQAWRATYSDHLPVTVDFAAAVDRDPHATFAPAGAERRLRPAAATVLGSGDRVRVSTGSATVEGRLLAPLGAWVHLIDTRGRRSAVPVHAVRSVLELDATNGAPDTGDR